MSGVLARLLFYPTLAYNVVMEKVSSRRWYDRIDQTIILGALPFRSMTEELVQKENVGGVITMNEEYETKYFCNSEEEWRAAGVEQLRLSTVDLTGVPSLENLHRGVAFTLEQRQHGRSVYIHCKAGRSRSATLAAACLIRKPARCWPPSGHIFWYDPHSWRCSDCTIGKSVEAGAARGAESAMRTVLLSH